jgi:predicted AlkP superfamily phosphohydrolase/phosphomutase/tetratricopeptide (TPR) repeat protein
MSDSVSTSALPTPNDRKLLLIGWDAADWKVALPLVEEGKMPNLKALMERGAWGRHATIQPMYSPMLWTSIATGKRAHKHGILGFSEPTPDGRGIRPITNLSRKTRAIWNIFTMLGLKSNVVGWWPSAPAEPIDGVMVSDHFADPVADLDKPWPIRPGTVSPESLAQNLAEMRIHPAELENEHILPFIPNAAKIDQEKDKRMESCAKIIAEISSYHAALTALMQLEPARFNAVYLNGIDHFCHGFMRYKAPKQPWVSQEDFDLYKDVVESGYRYHDMMLGTLVALAGPDTTIMLVSDHGFEPGNLRPQHVPNEPAGPAAEHSHYGMFLLAGPGIRKGEEVHGISLLDDTPTILHLFGLPVGRDMDGKVLVNCFEDEQKVEFVDSWDNFQGRDGRHPEGTQISSMDSAESLRQLVALGYIDAPNPDISKAVEETTRELKYNLAMNYMDAGMMADAASTLEALWNRWPEESRFGTKLLQCHIAIEDPAKARATLELLKARKETAMKSATKKLEELLKKLKEDAEKAGKEFKMEDVSERDAYEIRHLRAIAGINPAAMAFFEGSVLQLEKRYDEALDVLKKAESAQESNLPSLFEKVGRIHFERGDFESARKAFAHVIEINPENAEAHLGLAQIELRDGRPFDAAAEALASIELEFFNPRAHLAYGLALMRLRKPKMAEMTLLTAVNQNPNLAEAHKALARLYRRKFFNDETKAALHDKFAAEALERRRSRRASSVTASPIPTLPHIAARLDPLPKEAGAAIVVVSGLPRSGTSLLMQMLEAAKIPVVSDNKRAPDASNPRGYYEDERARKLPYERDRSWLEECRGKAVKIVAPVLGAVPEDLPVNVIFMERDIREVLASQKSMIEKLQTAKSDADEAAVARSYAAQLKNIDQYLAKRPATRVLPVSHAAALADPLATAKAVAEFLGGGLNINAMAAVVDKSLYHAAK